MAFAELCEAKERKYGCKWEPLTWFGGSCSRCATAFGVFEVRRHCRRCGRIVCAGCQYPERVLLAASPNKKIVCRVCGPPDQTAGAAPSNDTAVGSSVDLAPQPRASVASVASVACGSPCALCGEPLASECIVIDDEDSPLNGQIHVECFVCCADGEPITGPFTEDKGRLFCEDHYKEFFCLPCGGCGQKIVEGAVARAMGAQWHVGCFVCAWCSVPLGAGKGADDDSQFSFRVHNGAVYCEEDYLEHFCKKCNGCGFPVDLGLRAMDATWHRECFVCCACRKAFGDMEDGCFAVLDGQPFCAADAEAVGRLSAEERLLLQKLPPIAFANTGGVRKLSPEERGACLSQGLRHSLSPSGSDDKLSARAFKEWSRWSLAAGEGGSIQFEFGAFAPEVFAVLRQDVFGIKADEYKNSLCLRPLTGGKTGEGKSGMFFYFSWDLKCLVKTVSHEEVPFFMQCLKDYHAHVVGQPRNGPCTASLLPRFLGLYSAKFEGQPAVTFVVMSNVFLPRVELREQYDIKGVLGAQRFVSEEQLCNGTKVMKDRNFALRAKLCLGAAVKERLDGQIRRDVQFLRDHDRMDYSLLVGIAGSDAVEDAGCQWPVAECRGVRANTGVGEVYFMGIIDILQEYNWRKALENGVKTAGFCASSLAKARNSLSNMDNAVSAVCPSHYGQRFATFVSSRTE